MEIHPFSEDEILRTSKGLIEKIRQEILSLSDDYVLNASPAELEAYFISKVTIEPLILHPDERYIVDQSNTQIDTSHDPLSLTFPDGRGLVHGTQLDVAIPFDGARGLWDLRPSSYSLIPYPAIEVLENHIVLVIKFPHGSADPQRLKNEIDNKIHSLQGVIENLRNDVEKHNIEAKRAVIGVLNTRISSAQANVGAISALGIPIRRRNQPLTYNIPTQRRQSPTKPKASTEPYKREPVLEMEEYEYILGIMRSMSLVIERSPGSFSTLDEEAIRTHFLLQLNGHYEGTATGETFNASGKTDILIRVENRNVFIAECKFWRGVKYFSDAIDQILRYLSWRDTKCALLVFNKTKDTGGVRQKMQEIMQARPECKKTVFSNLDGDSRYVFTKESDPGKEIIITTQLYDMPT